MKLFHFIAKQFQCFLTIASSHLACIRKFFSLIIANQQSTKINARTLRLCIATNYQLLLENTLELEPIWRSFTYIFAFAILCNKAFPMHFACFFKVCNAVTGFMGCIT